jgi:hypothetical protein
MTEVYTLKEISEAIAKAENRKDKDKIFQQLRGAANRKLLKETDTYGPKGALRFALDEVASARILLRALDSGLSGAQLEQFADVFRSMESERRVLFPNGSQKCLSHSQAVETVDQGNWEVEIVELRDNSTGEPKQAGSWLFNGNRFGAADPLDPQNGVPGMTIEEVRRIPFSVLVSPVFAALQDKDN